MQKMESNFLDMKVVFDRSMKESTEMNQQSKDFSQLTRQRCVLEIGDLQQKINKLESLRSMIETNEWNHQQEFKAFDEAVQKDAAKNSR